MEYKFPTILIGLLLLVFLSPLIAQDAIAPPPHTDFPPTNDPKEIIRRSVEIDHKTMERARNYTCQQREVEKHLDSHGAVKSVEAKTWDITVLYGEPYSRLIQKNDKPLSEKDAKKEDEKMDKFIAERKNESAKKDALFCATSAMPMIFASRARNPWMAALPGY